MADQKRGVSFAGGQPQIPKGPGDKWKLPSHYQVKQVIGTGSYGSVCEAYNTRTKTLVAVKRVGHLFEDLIDCKRILREVAILSRLKNDNVVKLYDLPRPENEQRFDELYIIMEICDSDLKKLCRTDVTLTPLHINTLLYNVLVGLQYLHSAGIYHRDMKPANCLVNQDCSVKICDFGLSRAVEEAPYGNSLPDTPRGEESRSGAVVPSTQRMKRHLTGHVVTRWYRAPELILLQENYTAAIDVWSVGCIYAELLGMLEGTQTKDRGPLFPGSSCFPLSPDHKHKTDFKYHTKGKHDQLNMIFNLLGTPADALLDDLERDDAKRYLKCFSTRPGEGLKQRFKHVSGDMVGLLGKMLEFSASQRVTVPNALDDVVFREIRDKSKETTASSLIKLEFESAPDLDESSLREYFMKEVEKFGS